MEPSRRSDKGVISFSSVPLSWQPETWQRWIAFAQPREFVSTTLFVIPPLDPLA
jgi:hypothetical protein